MKETKNKEGHSSDKYVMIGIERLVLAGIKLVLEKGDTCTFERLVKECFERFPKTFRFKRYPQWPDSSKFDRNLRKLREKGLIVGSIKDKFYLTEFGDEIASKELLELDSKNGLTINRKYKYHGRSSDDKLIEYLKNSEIFRHYVENSSEISMTESDFRNFLRCTLETPLRILKLNLQYSKQLSKYYNENELYNFLLLCERKFMRKERSNE